MPGGSGGGGRGGGGGGGRSSGGGSKGSSGSGGKPMGNPLTSSSSSSTFGGGSPITIRGGSPFAGRTYGGASRPGIYAGAGFGAGYAGAHGYNNVNGRNFGYGYWPLYWYDGYYGNDEYGPRDNSSRPGGALTSSYFNPPSSNSSAPPQYALFGDTDSIGDMNTTLIERCQAVFVLQDETNSELSPAPNTSRVIQYYRESSFALLSYFVNSSAPQEITGTQSGPVYTGVDRETQNSTFYLYPSESLNQTFQSCVNQTIGDNLIIIGGDTGDSSGIRQFNMEYQGILMVIPLILAIYLTFFGRRFVR